MGKTEFEKVASKVSIVNIICNMALSIIKLVAGILGNSSALVSDAIHSAADVFSTVVVLVGVMLSSKEADKEHPYGHERLECVAAMVLSMFLFVTGLTIGLGALRTILAGNYGDIVMPGVVALVVAFISIVAKEAMHWFTRYNAKIIDSSALMADAWHHRTDAFASAGALFGIGGARLGFPVMDSVASLIIFLFITKAALDVFKDAMNKLVDHCCDDKTEKEIYDLVISNENVQGVNSLRTRMFGNRVCVDIEITVEGSYSLYGAKEVADTVKEDVKSQLAKVKHVMVHVNPK